MIHSNSPVRPTGRPQCRVVMLAAVVVGNWACSLPAIPSPSSRRSSGEESAYRSSRLQPKPSRMTSSNAGRGGSRPASYSDNVTFAPVTARHVRGVRGQAGHRPGRPRDVGAGPHVAGPGASADRRVTGAYGRRAGARMPRAPNGGAPVRPRRLETLPQRSVDDRARPPSTRCAMAKKMTPGARIYLERPSVWFWRTPCARVRLLSMSKRTRQ